jgi:hypothetical protein
LHCQKCAESARIIQRDLGVIGLDVTIREVNNVRAAVRSGMRFDLLDLRSDIPYPDPASFMGQVLDDVPNGWVPQDDWAEVRRVMASTGSERFAAAAALADRLSRAGAPFAAYGVPGTPQFLAPSVGCRVFTSVGHGVDLAHLCPAGR